MTVTKRFIIDEILTSLKLNDVTVLLGAKETGKTIISKLLTENISSSEYFNLNDAMMYFDLIREPERLSVSDKDLIIIDEVNKHKNIFKNKVSNKKFLYTSSYEPGNGFSKIQLYPLSVGEINNSKEGFINFLFSDDTQPELNDIKINIAEHIVSGGYPDVLKLWNNELRHEWFSTYILSIQNEIKYHSDIDNYFVIPEIISQLAHRTNENINLSSIANAVDLPNTTMKRYFRLLRDSFIITLIKPFSIEGRPNTVKASRLLFTDTGLLCNMLNIENEQELTHYINFRHILRNFVIMEIIKQASWHKNKPVIQFYQTLRNDEVDIVLELDGKVCGIQVRWWMDQRQNDQKDLLKLAAELPGRFHRGIILYNGNKIQELSEKVLAIPLDYLWRIPSVDK